MGGVRSGDLIQRIGRYEIKDIDGYRKAMKAITKDQPDRVVFVILRDQRTHFQYVEPDWKPTSADETAKDKRQAQSDQGKGVGTCADFFEAALVMMTVLAVVAAGAAKARAQRRRTIRRCCRTRVRPS